MIPTLRNLCAHVVAQVCTTKHLFNIIKGLKLVQLVPPIGGLSLGAKPPKGDGV
jgi:hypothetical protein